VATKLYPLKETAKTLNFGGRSALPVSFENVVDTALLSTFGWDTHLYVFQQLHHVGVKFNDLVDFASSFERLLLIKLLQRLREKVLVQRVDYVKYKVTWSRIGFPLRMVRQVNPDVRYSFYHFQHALDCKLFWYRNIDVPDLMIF